MDLCFQGFSNCRSLSMFKFRRSHASNPRPHPHPDLKIHLNTFPILHVYSIGQGLAAASEPFRRRVDRGTSHLRGLLQFRGQTETLDSAAQRSDDLECLKQPKTSILACKARKNLKHYFQFFPRNSSSLFRYLLMRSTANHPGRSE